jgi:amino acid adenylation domain-containing protein
MSEQTVAGFRLSSQQERTWSQQAGVMAPFWAECELDVSGALDPAKLQGAIRAVVARHEILRTGFHLQTGVTVPFQIIRGEPSFGWSAADLSGLEPAAQRTKLISLISEPNPAFDLEKGPALHVVLAKVAPERHTLVLSLPALCADRRTLANLVDEIAAIYATGAVTEEETLQYADVAEWQQEMLASEESKAARDYWRDGFGKIDFDALGTTLAAFSKRNPGAFAPVVVERQVEVSLFGSLADDRLPGFLLTAWLAFLSRMTGRSTLTIGCCFEGRNYTELQSALGAFAKYLPLTAEISEGTRLDQLLEQVSRELTEFGNWQGGFSWQGAGLPAGQEQGPVLPVAFEYVGLPEATAHVGLAATMVRQEVIAERFELKLSVRRTGGSMNLAFYFDSSRLDRETVARWSGHFVTLLTAAATWRDTAVQNLPLLSEAERQRMLTEWNQTASEYPRGLCFHDLFEAQAARTPNAPAVRYQDDCLSYEQLNQRANQLAHYLRAKGICANALVGLCMERSTEMMVAVLGILKAGGAYVPLSAEHPKARLEQQLAGAAALVTESKFECMMPPFGGLLVLMDHEREQWSLRPSTNPQPAVNPENYAYVIYTSGSTGTPKGVAVRHRNLVNYTCFIQNRLELENCPESLHFATVSTLGADLGNTCIYPALASGGCLHVVGSDVAADSDRLREYMTKYPVDVLKIVPTHLMALLNAGGGREVLPRKYLILGGEAFTFALLEKILATGTGCEILNHYGPTETTVGSLTLRMKDYRDEGFSAKTIPLGRPIANTRLYILDAHGEPVPVGVAGELFIGGEGVTAGYVGQADRTAERFVPERLGPDPSACMYRTGDVVRYLPDGNVEFLGRADDQVKIRGFRIELGEVEAVLLKHPGINQAAVLAVADERGEKSLAAYVVGAVSRDDLRTYLRGQLPDYMVPSAIVELPKMPLNANGKIDRQALPTPEDGKNSARESVAPRTPSEEVVAAIWSEVLKREDVGVEDNFFEIGGHSLLATQIASRLREHFKISVPVRAVFESPSIAELAKRLDTARREEQGILPPPIGSIPRGGTLPLSFAQERLWVLDQIEPNNPLYNIPRTLRLRGTLRVEALERAINEIVRRHESQRTSFSMKDGDPVQVISPTLTIPLTQHDFTTLPEAEREAEARRFAVDETMRPFDLRQAPLVRADLLRLSPDDHVLQLTMHHIISDAWSAGIFLQELGVLYEAFCAGRASPLAELKVQYADYAAQERAWLQGEVLDRQLAFWRERLEGVPPVLELPLDRKRPDARTFAGSCEMLHIPAESMARIKALARQEGATLFMTLMAAFQALLSKYSGEEQIVVGTDLANRTLPETERMIGFFINLLAIRTDLSGNPTFRELLARVREGLLESYAHQEVPFPKVVQEVQPERSATHNPIVQVLFVMQNIPRAKRELFGLQVEPFEVPVTSSKFDMAVFVAERPDGLIGYWVYSTELFEQFTIRRMLGHYCNLLDQAVEHPDTRLSALSMLSEEEIQQQEAEKHARKQSQFRKLKSTAAAAVGLTGDTPVKPPS